jgi:acyl-CoA thioesterase FadM
MVRHPAHQAICAGGGATMLWVDGVQQKALALPDRLRALVQN